MKRIIEAGFFAVYFYQNPHRTVHDTAKEWLETWGGDGVEEDDAIEGSSIQKMIETDTIFYLQIYPKNSVGFLVYFSHDYQLLVDYVADRLEAIKS